MVIKREVAYGIVQGLSEFWNCEELQDFTVTLGSTKFGCHRVLLAACSGYFRGLFRSGMKETQLKSVNVKDISSETFGLILETMYTGRGVLTNDNVIDIWRATHQLQITFLEKECEDFIFQTLSINNYLDYFHNAKNLNSETVSNLAWSFILKNSNAFFKTPYFLDLTLDDVIKLVKSQDLITSSEDEVLHAIIKWVDSGQCGDQQGISTSLDEALKQTSHVIQDTQENVEENQAVSKHDTERKQELSDCKQMVTKCHALMSSHNENTNELNTGTRLQHLPLLLSLARTCTANHKCLESLLRLPMVSEDKNARNIICDALLYQLQPGKRNGQWPSGAIYRNNSSYENVAVTFFKSGHEFRMMAFSFSRNKWLNIGHLRSKGTICLTAIDKMVYALESPVSAPEAKSEIVFSFGCKRNVTYDEDECKNVASKDVYDANANDLQLFKLIGHTWSNTKIVINLPREKKNSTAVVDTFIYIFSFPGPEVWKLDPTSKTQIRVADLPDNLPICHVMSYYDFILVFSSTSRDGVDEAVIQCYDTLQNVWTRLNNLEGPATGMTSFKDDHSAYLLQSTGDVWKLVKPQSNVLDFEHVVKLWNCEWSLHGAVTFMDKLYIYGVKSETLKNDPQLRLWLSGVFKKIIYMESESTDTVNFLPVVLNRNYLV